jgi:ABC-type Fe3+ transport system permease subunit
MSANWSPLWESVGVAAVGVSAAIVPAVCAGWALARVEFRGKKVVGGLASLPSVLPPLVLGAAVIAAIAERPGVFTPLLGTAAAACWAFASVMRAVRADFESIGPAYARAARCLGASGWRIFSVVEAPMAAAVALQAALLALPRLAIEYAVARILLAPAGARDAFIGGPTIPALVVAAVAGILLAARLERKRACA